MKAELQQAISKAQEAQKNLLSAQAVADPLQIQLAQQQLELSQQYLTQLQGQEPRTSGQQLQYAANLVAEALSTLKQIQTMDK